MNAILTLGACCTLALPQTAVSAGHSSAAAVSPRPPASLVADDSTARRRFDIPAQPLADALADFARQAGVRVTASGDALRGIRANAVDGSYATVDALRILLQGTGISAGFVDAYTVTVRSGSDDEVQSLSRVVVTAAGVRRAGYAATRSVSATRTDVPLRDTPQAVTVVTSELIADQAMQGMSDVVRYVPGVTMGQGEGHRDAPTIRGNSTTADFFVNGVRDDVQYLRDLYNVDRVEALKGANALAFGRGGGGGVINRVLKDAQWVPVHSILLQGGTFDQKRAAVDLGQGLGRFAAVRFNGMYENSGSFRQEARVERLGVNPTVTVAAGAHTTLRLGYEHFRDDRTVDRGLPSFQGAPAPNGGNRFFGNPDLSASDVRVHSAGAMVEHLLTPSLTLRNRTQVSAYDKFYQNVYPGAVTGDGVGVALSAYSSGTDRTNLFNQTDLIASVVTGPFSHTVVVGAEVGRQGTENRRLTGRFDGTAAADTVPFAAPVSRRPVVFAASASDANNRVTAGVAGVYVQDQIAITRQWQVVGGVRYDRFAMRFDDHRNGQRLERTDEMLSPRAGLVFKPIVPLSFYGSYGVSYLPSSGDQFASLTATSRTLEPEQFRNVELGAKWDVVPQLAVTSAIYRLDRTNTSAPHPTDPTLRVQTGEQRTTGYELGVTGSPVPAWQIAGGYASQRAEITSTTSAAPAGRTVPLVPRQSLSLWNRYQFVRALGGGLGVVHQSSMFAAIDNKVTLPAFTRFDAAVFVSLPRGTRAQLNVENLLDERYYPTSHGNNNIMPGASRTARVSLIAGF